MKRTVSACLIGVICLTTLLAFSDSDVKTGRLNLTIPAIGNPGYAPKINNDLWLLDGGAALLGLPNVFSSMETFLGPVSFSQVVTASTTYSINSLTAEFAGYAIGAGTVSASGVNAGNLGTGVLITTVPALNGSQLTNLTGANVTGTVPLASTATSIAGGSVSATTGKFTGNVTIAGPIPWIDPMASPYNAYGDGSHDDTAALQSALNAAAGGTLFIPNGTFKLASGCLNYSPIAQGPITIQGEGYGSKLQIINSTCAVNIYDPTAGLTYDYVNLRNFEVLGPSTTTAPSGILLSGVSILKLDNLTVIGNSHITKGIDFVGAQQGEMAGGFIGGCTYGAYLEMAANSTASNGIDMHGVSFNNITTNIELDHVDDAHIHANHLTTANGLEILHGGYAETEIIGNHIEPLTPATFGIHISTNDTSSAYIAGNSINSWAGSYSIFDEGGGYITYDGNLLTSSVTFAASTTNNRYCNNYQSNGSFTQGGTNFTMYGNTVNPGYGAGSLGTIFPGVTSGASAPAGDVGEYISSVTAVANVPNTSGWGDVAHITLTAGDWDVSAWIHVTLNGASVNAFVFGIGTASGTGSTGLTYGDTELGIQVPGNASNPQSGNIGPRQYISSGGQTLYLKLYTSVGSGTPQCAGTIRARRVR